MLCGIAISRDCGGSELSLGERRVGLYGRVEGIFVNHLTCDHEQAQAASADNGQVKWQTRQASSDNGRMLAAGMTGGSHAQSSHAKSRRIL